MLGSRRCCVTGIALCALLVGAVIAPASNGAGGDAATHEVGHVVFTGPVDGLLVVKAASRSRTRMYLSLHGLRRNTAYDVIASTRPCGRSLTNASRLFGIDVHASQATDSWQSLLYSVPFSRVSTMKSVRIIGEPRDGSATRSYCYQKITFN